MSIVVYYLRNQQPEGEQPQWLPQCLPFSDTQMSEALKQCQLLRGDLRNAHVTISSELRDMVGPVGVAAVEDGQTPTVRPMNGARPAAREPAASTAQQPPVTREQMDR